MLNNLTGIMAQKFVHRYVHINFYWYHNEIWSYLFLHQQNQFAKFTTSKKKIRLVSNNFGFPSLFSPESSSFHQRPRHSIFEFSKLFDYETNTLGFFLFEIHNRERLSSKFWNTKPHFVGVPAFWHENQLHNKFNAVNQMLSLEMIQITLTYNYSIEISSAFRISHQIVTKMRDSDG